MMISVARHDQRGTANSTILVAWDIGMGLGILLGGIISEHLGYAAAFWFVALINFVGVVLYFVATRQFFLRRRLAE
jgi:predicted MFS family arabinose efflux permease